jgi:hypothetical protein
MVNIEHSPGFSWSRPICPSDFSTEDQRRRLGGGVVKKAADSMSQRPSGLKVRSGMKKTAAAVSES